MSTIITVLMNLMMTKKRKSMITSKAQIQNIGYLLIKQEHIGKLKITIKVKTELNQPLPSIPRSEQLNLKITGLTSELIVMKVLSVSFMRWILRFAVE